MSLSTFSFLSSAANSVGTSLEFAAFGTGPHAKLRKASAFCFLLSTTIVFATVQTKRRFVVTCDQTFLFFVGGGGGGRGRKPSPVKKKERLIAGYGYRNSVTRLTSEASNRVEV